MDNINENIEEQNKTLSDGEVMKAASEMMDRFDDAFKELAK